MKNRWAWVIFALIVGFVISNGAYRLTESPPTWYDEGMILQLAENLADRGSMVMQLAPGTFVSAWHVSTGYPVVVPVAVAFKAFGIGILPARSVAVAFMVMLAIAAFILLRRLYGPWNALGGMALIATFSSFYGNGKNVLGEIPGLFFFMLALYLFDRLEKSRFSDWRWALASSIALGLTCSAKPIFFLAIPALIIAAILKRKTIQWRRPWMLAFVAGGVITGTIWVLMQFGPADSISSILHFYANPYDAESISSPIIGNIARFFTEATPIYTLLTFVIWMTALVIRRVRRSPVAIAELCAAAFSVLILLAYLRMPWWYRYFFPANIVILAFLPQAIQTFVSAFRGIFKWMDDRMVRKHLPLAAFAIFLVFQTYYLFSESWISSAASGTQTADLAVFGRSIDPRDDYFIFDEPQIVPFLRTDNYYQYFYGSGVWEAGAEYLELLRRGEPDFVIIQSQGIEAAEEYLGRYEVESKVGRYSVLGRKGSK